ncbi:hypothetical protein [Sphingomonas japonica]|uniref:Uncharacterized protein n=1 Tax=Sphingomonas japonica TaxID=511662 RepID=A0ABX0U0B8_9SPHN|nr:hypothetical protein [Sphingomonas japonica]NIJ24020.1 hypothetical protein [Sphingomonas japonica]
MGYIGQGQDMIRAELAQRVFAIDALADAGPAHRIAAELEAVRALAQAHGLSPAVTVIHALDSALSRGEHGAIVHGWLAILADAVGSGACDAQSDALFAAACQVRLGG